LKYIGSCDISYLRLSMTEQLELQRELNFNDWNKLSLSQKDIIYHEATGKEPDIYEPE